MLARILQRTLRSSFKPCITRSFAIQSKHEAPHTVKVHDTPSSPSPAHDSKFEADIKSELHSEAAHRTSNVDRPVSEEELRFDREDRFDNRYVNSDHFGFQDVRPEEKQGKVNEVFHSVADNYDVMNDVMSLGIHRFWKDQFVDEIGYLSARREVEGEKLVNKPAVVLDVAGGTGDISFRIYEKNRRRANHFGQKDLKIKVLDINSSMLRVGADRARKLGYDEDIEFIEGNAESLDLPDNSVDLYTIVFGIRNVPKIELALKEAHRVLKKGGRFLCMEFSKVENPILSEIYKFYNFNIIPTMGCIIAQDRESYQYLAESIEKFPDQETFLAMIEEAGFEYASYKNYTNGIVAVHSGFKL